MKFAVKNLGPLKDAGIQLKPLTIIAGCNNTGKTYFTYALYGFLKMWRECMTDVPEKVLAELMQTGRVVIPMTEIELRKKTSLIACAAAYSKQLHVVFSAAQSSFDGASVTVEILGEFRGPPLPKREIRFGSGKKAMEAALDGENLVISLTNDDSKTKPPPLFLQHILGYVLADFTLGQFLPPPFILSAERLGIALFYKELDIAKNVMVEAIQKMASQTDKPSDRLNPIFAAVDEFTARYARPVKDNIDFTRDLSNIQKQSSPLLKDHSLPDYIKNMMEGYFRQTGSEIKFVSSRRGDNHFEIPLFLASSSARAVSDLYFYLKHVAKKGDLLMIDEPESHLSPANQVSLARLLGLCVQAGVCVYITTHSDYIVKEFNNLILLGNEFKGRDEFLAKHKTEYAQGMGLKPEQIGAYVCKGGKFEECPVTKRGMIVESFDDTINRMNEVGDDLEFLLSSQEV